MNHEGQTAVGLGRARASAGRLACGVRSDLVKGLEGPAGRRREAGMGPSAPRQGRHEALSL